MHYIIYILGPMRGIPQYNFPAFDEAAQALRYRFPGATILNPAEMDREAGLDPVNLPLDYDWFSLPEGHTIEDIMERDLAAVRKANAYVALPGWEKSKGARAEKGVLDWKKAEDLSACIPTQPSPLETPPYLETLSTAPMRFEFPTDNGGGTNPKDILGMKKPPLRLVPWLAVLYLSRAMAHGAKKYGPWNWRKNKVLMSVYIEAALRHLIALLDGQDVDEESGLPHQAHIMACMAIITDAEAVGAMVDDRNKSGKTAELIKQLTEKI